MKSPKLSILFCSSEVAPFSKVGGLGDVAGALPAALHALGHDVRIVTPRYRRVDPDRFIIAPVDAEIPRGPVPSAPDVELREARLPGCQVPVYLVECPSLFDRDDIYGPGGKDYPDNLQRFSVFSHAVASLPRALGWKPDVVHLNDWQTGLVPSYLTRASSGAATVMTIHNLGYQGLFDAGAWPLVGLPDELFSVEGLEFYGHINLLKAGLVHADVLTTVSPTYAREIQTPEHGFGLDGVLRDRASDLYGILNGADYEVWSPASDSHLPQTYDADDLAGKAACKAALQKESELPVRDDVPVLGLISRLAAQKGLDILAAVLDELLDLDIQVVVLGTGEERYEEWLREAAEDEPTKLAAHIRFDERLAHLIEAGCDMFLMPSHYEPCGLNQMYSLRYGTIPVVRRTGGLADTVVDYRPSTLVSSQATGFHFAEYSAEGLLKAILLALATWRNRSCWSEMVQTAMAADFSWERSAEAYVEVYRTALSRRRA